MGKYQITAIAHKIISCWSCSRDWSYNYTANFIAEWKSLRLHLLHMYRRYFLSKG